MSDLRKKCDSLVIGAISIGFLILFVLSLYNLRDGVKRDEKASIETYRTDLARYNQIRYCEQCNSIYDANQNVQDANEFGLHRMMQISS